MKKKKLLGFTLLITTIFNVIAQEPTIAPEPNLTLPNITPPIPTELDETIKVEETTSNQQSTQIDAQEKKEDELIKSGLETEKLSTKDIGEQGNWVLKEEWLKESLKLNDKISDLLEAIQKSKNSYQEKFEKVDNELDIFYKEEGLSQGKIQELFDSLNKYIEKRKQKEIEIARLEEKEQGITGEFEIKLDIIDKQIDDNRSELEQLKFDVNSIEELDKSIKDRLKTVDEQISISENEAEKASSLADEIWAIIDDKIARSKYYEIKNISAKIKARKEYLEKTLLNDFDKVIKTIQSQIARIKAQIENLEKKEFIIRNRIERIKELKISHLEEEPTKQIDEVKEIKKESSWYQKIYDQVVNVTARIYIFFKNIFNSEEKAKVKELVKEESNDLPMQVEEIKEMEVKTEEPTEKAPEEIVPESAQINIEPEKQEDLD